MPKTQIPQNTPNAIRDGSTITQAQADAIAAFLASHDLPQGLGTEEEACSIAAINLAMNGKLTDDIPTCMSPAIGKWIICIQDAMPSDMRNSAEWKRLLPLAAGTGRALEKQRAAVALAWMWDVVLPQLQPLAEKHGFGKEWQNMTAMKTSNAANAAAKAAYTAADAAAYAAANAAAKAAAKAADAAAYAAYAAADAAAKAADAYAAANAADAANAAAKAADAANAAAYADFWIAVNPCKCLADMIEVA